MIYLKQLFLFRRRSPKKQADMIKNSKLDDVEEKLNQEAFRLSRTIHNLLNTSLQQPDLTQHHHSHAQHRLGCSRNSTPSASTMTLHTPNHNSTLLAMPSNSGFKSPALNSCNSSNVTDIMFLRSANIRDSRLSLRSSTDSSVHSTTSSSASCSSKVETDEEGLSLFTHCNARRGSNSVSLSKTVHAHNQQTGSTTEDESGFSSISSFQEIGVPLSSTLLSSKKCINSQNENLKPNQLPNNVLGLPTTQEHSQQQKWETKSNAKTHFNASQNKLQRFSTLSNEDSATVLWV